jgi:hypothetical protein
MSTEEQPPAAAAPAEGGEPKLSKNALKKKLKAEKAAKAKAEKAAAKVSIQRCYIYDVCNDSSIA